MAHVGHPEVYDTGFPLVLFRCLECAFPDILLEIWDMSETLVKFDGASYIVLSVLVERDSSDRICLAKIAEPPPPRASRPRHDEKQVSCAIPCYYVHPKE